MLRKKASTLIETIVALIVIMIILSISVITVSNIQKNNIRNKAHAFNLIQSEFKRVKQNQLFYSEENKHAEFVIKRTVSESKFGKSLKILNIEIVNKEKQILIRKREIVSVE